MLPSESTPKFYSTGSVRGGTRRIPVPDSPPQLTSGFIKSYLRDRGIIEDVLVHSQDYKQFLTERGIKELGRGGEGAVYFLRGHVVKLIGADYALGALREAVHMLHLNPHAVEPDEATMGDRSRQDWPSMLWIYTLSNGSVSVGMKPFDLNPSAPQGSTLYDRLAVGPLLERAQVLRAIRMIGGSLRYSQRKGINHHDLKPANIYIPGDPAQQPVVFDLGQALWNRSAWGAQWLRHPHNGAYWYNGTYQYMHYVRRLSHLAAVATSEERVPTEKQAQAFNRYIPSFYDDAFAFAYIIRDCLRSRFAVLNEKDRAALQVFYRAAMGLKDRRAQLKKGRSIAASLSGFFGFQVDEEPPAAGLTQYETMELLMPKLEAVLDGLG